LSGDVVPASGSFADELVIIDRFPASVLSWVDLRSARVRAQLSVATGFAANPHDYAALSATKAYVARYEPNLAPGSAPFDSGSDVLVIDPSAPSITASIDLTPAMRGEDPKYYPRPDRMALIAGKLYVLSSGYTLDFLEAADSRVVVIDTERDV